MSPPQEKSSSSSSSSIPVQTSLSSTVAEHHHFCSAALDRGLVNHCVCYLFSLVLEDLEQFVLYHQAISEEYDADSEEECEELFDEEDTF